MSSICERLGIRYPIIQGAMTKVADVRLASAVSAAGGLGIYTPGIVDIDLDRVRNDIQTIKKSIPNDSFGVNVMLASKYSQQIVDIICEEHVPVVTTGAGSPAKYIDQLKRAGVIVAPVISTREQAVKMEAVGADVVIASGMEGGGYIGRISTLALVPQVVDSVSIPVIAAGGIADGRGMAAVLILGAQGVQMGTRFMATVECNIPDWCKQAMLSATSSDAVVLGDRVGAPARARALKTDIAVEILTAEGADGATVERFNQMLSDARTNFDNGLPKTLISSGQSVGMVDDIPTVAALIQRMAAQCREALSIAKSNLP